MLRESIPSTHRYTYVKVNAFVAARLRAGTATVPSSQSSESTRAAAASSSTTTYAPGVLSIPANLTGTRRGTGTSGDGFLDVAIGLAAGEYVALDGTGELAGCAGAPLPDGRGG